MSLPRYPKYKPSGVEWLGDVPEGWEVDRIKRSVLSSKNGVWGAEPQQDESDIPCVRVADFDRQKLRIELSEPTIRNVVESERVGRVLCKGDLLLEKAGGGELQPVGCVVLYDDDRPAVCSNFVARVQVAPGMNASFWRYAHAAAYAVRLNTRSIKQTSGIQNLDGSQYFDERAAFPPLPEQTAIAEFLDRETGKIDGLVAEQRRLMELLKEKRQAVISHAVTKGLNAHAPLKPSGIDWLGDMPTGWTLRRLQGVCSFSSGKAHEPFICDDGAYKCVTARFISTEGAKSKNCSENLSPAKKNDTLMVMSDLPNGRALAKAFYVADDGAYAVNQRVCILRPHKVHPKYLYYLLDRNPEFLRHDDGINQTHLSNADFLKPQFPIPPQVEQESIVNFLDVELGKFDRLTAEAQRAIDLLQERRTALITAAVTGQIDVRQQPKN